MKDSDDNDKKPLTVMVTTRKSGRHRVLDCYPMVLAVPDNEVKSLGYSSVLGHCRLHGQTDTDKLRDPEYTQRDWVYATGVQYDRSDLLEYEMEAALKHLRAINRKLAKIEGLAGYPASFGALVQRFAVAVGADSITTESSFRRKDVTGYPLYTHTLADGANMVDHALRAWAEELQPKIEVAC